MELELKQLQDAVTTVVTSKEQTDTQINEVKSALETLATKDSVQLLQTKNTDLESTIDDLKEQVANLEVKGQYSMETPNTAALTVKSAGAFQAKELAVMLKSSQLGQVKAVDPMNTANLDSAGITITGVIEAGVIKPLKDFSPILSKVEIGTLANEKSGSRRVRVTGTDSRYTSENINGVQADNSAVPSYKVLEPTFGYLESAPAITLEMIQDSDYDMPSEISECVAEEFREQLAHMVLKGDGVAMKGLLENFGSEEADSARAFNTYQTHARTAKFGVDFKTTIAKLQAMKRSVPTGHRASSEWYMNEESYDALMLMTDTTGAPLIHTNWTEDTNGKLIGYNIVIDPTMPGLSDAGQIAIMFGDIGSAFKFFYVHGLHQELRSPAPRLFQYYHSLRIGSRVSQTRALKGLRNPAA